MSMRFSCTSCVVFIRVLQNPLRGALPAFARAILRSRSFSRLVAAGVLATGWRTVHGRAIATLMGRRSPAVWRRTLRNSVLRVYLTLDTAKRFPSEFSAYKNPAISSGVFAREVGGPDA